jgi:hypothetical protein
MGFKICLNKNLDGLVAGVDFDADRCIAEIDFVSATIVSPDDSREAFTSPSDLAVCCSRHGHTEVEHHCSPE